MVIDCHAHLEPRMLELDRIMALHVDLSSPYLDEPLARAAVAAMGPERCLYGTDSPYGFHGDDGSYDYGAIRGWIERLPVSAQERDRVFADNFQAILADAGAVT